MAKLNIKAKRDGMWDLVSLGEVMLRLDPGDRRISTTRHFRAWEGGGEYNVARGLRRCFGMNTAVVTALADNPVGRLIEDLMLQGGVNLKYLRWAPYRRCRPKGAQRPELHRTRIRRTRRSRLLGSRTHRRLADEARRDRLGPDVLAKMAPAGFTPEGSSARSRKPRRWSLRKRWRPPSEPGRSFPTI